MNFTYFSNLPGRFFRFWFSQLRWWLGRLIWFWNLRRAPRRFARVAFWCVWITLLVVLSVGAFTVGVVGGFFWEEAKPIIAMKLHESWSDRNLRRTRQRGDAIVAALNAYFQREGRYPTTLQALVPRDLPAIKPPTVGDCRWHYERTANAKSFTLVVYSKYWDTMDASLLYSYPSWYAYNQRMGWWLHSED